MRRRNGGSPAIFRLRARQRIWALLPLGLAAIALSALTSMSPLLSGHSEVRQVTRDDVALMHVMSLAQGLTEFQVFVEPHMSNLARATPVDLAQAALLAQAVPPLSKSVVDDLLALHQPQTADELKTADAAYTNVVAGLGVLATGTPSQQVSVAIADERAAFTRIWSVVSTADHQLRIARDEDLRQAGGYLDNGSFIVLIVDVLAALVTIGAAIMLGQRAGRRERREHATAERRTYEKSLQDALEMATDESAAYRIIGKALRQAVPDLQVELHVADSSHAHFHETLNADLDTVEGSQCGVDSPLDCPATTRGHTLVFPSSRELSACPYLQDRLSGECSAACVPFSIGGKTVGVLHATGADGVPPAPRAVDYLELTVRRASERVTMIRAFAKSETQARSDPLTGLWNRRSLENRINDLRREGTPYAIAYGDLDHFKILNDTHGHEAGDQALRLFARVLREAVRPNDITARYGGEEFVIVLPDCPVETAVSVLERVRERLALALASGRVPSFTVSFGLASSIDADTFDEVVAIADRALLNAKEAGRNRVVLATPTLPENDTPEPDQQRTDASRESS